MVAVSGGPDSVALLRVLALLRAEFALRPLVIAHVNHRLRGAESDADQAFVHDLHRQLAASDPAALVWREHAVDVREQQAAGEGLESAARAERYRWLTDVALECGAPLVATGHTANDQAETVLHRLLRGTGVRGLAGIPPRRALAAGIDVIRPLLEVRRQDVTDFLAEQHQPFRRDSSNTDPRFTRNRIRLELLPMLERDYNPGIAEVLCRLAQQARVQHRATEAQAAELLQLRAESCACAAGRVAHIRGKPIARHPTPVVVRNVPPGLAARTMAATAHGLRRLAPAGPCRAWRHSRRRPPGRDARSQPRPRDPGRPDPGSRFVMSKSLPVTESAGKQTGRRLPDRRIDRAGPQASVNWATAAA